MGVQHLRRFHRLAEEIVAYAERHNLALARETYTAGFDGSFSITFEAAPSAGTFDGGRRFQLVRDGRDDLLLLEVLAPKEHRPRFLRFPRRQDREWRPLKSRNFDRGRAWDGALYEAATQLIDEIAV